MLLPLLYTLVCTLGTLAASLQTERCEEGKVYQMRQCGYELRCNANRILRHRSVNSTSSCAQRESTNWDRLPTCAVNGTNARRSAHPTDCSRYLERKEWMFHERRCARGSSFNASSCRCEQTPTCFPTLPKHFRAYAIPNLADKFEIEALHENAVVQCFRGEHFQENRGACEPIVEGAKTLENDDFAPGPCKESMRRDGYRNHPTDCAKFFQCAQGTWVLMDCPAGLVFDLDLVRCEHPKT